MRSICEQKGHSLGRFYWNLNYGLIWWHREWYCCITDFDPWDHWNDWFNISVNFICSFFSDSKFQVIFYNDLKPTIIISWEDANFEKMKKVNLQKSFHAMQFSTHSFCFLYFDNTVIKNVLKSNSHMISLHLLYYSQRYESFNFVVWVNIVNILLF